MPQVELPADFEVDEDKLPVVAPRGRRSVVPRTGAARAYINVRLHFGEYFINPTADKRGDSFQFFQRPTFDIPSDVIVYRPQSMRDIDITVRFLLQFCALFADNHVPSTVGGKFGIP